MGPEWGEAQRLRAVAAEGKLTAAISKGVRLKRAHRVACQAIDEALRLLATGDAAAAGAVLRAVRS